MPALEEYLDAAAGDPFKIRAGIEEMIRRLGGSTSPKANRLLERSLWSMNQGICSFSVELEWGEHLRALPWWRRLGERRREAAWREERYRERKAEAEAEVRALVRG